VAKHGAKSAAKTATRVASLATPISIAADLTQMGFEAIGYKKTGKAVGATGNVASGAMAGMLVGGPVGAVIGGAAGYTLWQGGEFIGQCTDKLVDYIAPDENKDKEEPSKSDEEASTPIESNRGENTLGKAIGEEAKEKEDGSPGICEAHPKEQSKVEQDEATGIWASGRRVSNYFNSWLGPYLKGSQDEKSDGSSSRPKPDDTTSSKKNN